MRCFSILAIEGVLGLGEGGAIEGFCGCWVGGWVGTVFTCWMDGCLRNDMSCLMGLHCMAWRLSYCGYVCMVNSK